MGKKSRQRGGALLPLLLLGGAALAANSFVEKAAALRQVAENWEVSGAKFVRMDGLNAILQVGLTFYNTSRQSAVLEALNMTLKYKGSVIGTMRLPARTTIKPQGTTKVNAEVSLALATLLTRAVSAAEAVKFVALLKGKSAGQMLDMVSAKAGLRGVTFEGDIVVAGVQKHFSFTTDLGNVSTPVKPQLSNAADAVVTTTNTTA